MRKKKKKKRHRETEREEERKKSPVRLATFGCWLETSCMSMHDFVYLQRPAQPKQDEDSKQQK